MNGTAGALVDDAQALEARRQQALLAAIADGREAAPHGLSGLPGRAGQAASVESGLDVYRANALAIAERALAAVYPTVHQLVGDESFAALARAIWREQPPWRGDLAWFGDGLATRLADTPELAPEAYLADVARLEWRVHRAQFAADHDAPMAGLDLLATADPSTLQVDFVPGASCLASQHPVVAIWQAHRVDLECTIGSETLAGTVGQADPLHRGDPVEAGGQEPRDAGMATEDRFAEVRRAFAQGRRDAALVWRQGWQVRVACLTPAEVAFTQDLMRGASLGEALDHVAGEAGVTQDFSDGSAFSFESWLVRAVREGWLAGIRVFHREGA